MRLDHESKSFNLLRNKYVVKVIRSANLLALLQKNWTRPCAKDVKTLVKLILITKYYENLSDISSYNTNLKERTNNLHLLKY